MILPNVMNSTSTFENIHETFVDSFLVITTSQTRIDVKVTNVHVLAVIIRTMFAITARDTTTRFVRIGKLKVRVPYTSTSNLYV